MADVASHKCNNVETFFVKSFKADQRDFKWPPLNKTIMDE